MKPRHKKSTSGEAPIHKQDYGTTPEEKSEAEMPNRAKAIQDKAIAMATAFNRRYQ